jgi:hypothetical protein
LEYDHNLIEQAAALEVSKERLRRERDGENLVIEKQNSYSALFTFWPSGLPVLFALPPPPPPLGDVILAWLARPPELRHFFI